MEISAGRRGWRASPLAVAAVLVTVVLTLGGCASTATTTGVPASSAVTSASPASAASSGCNADYCTPRDWETARASTPLAQIPPFVEPLNVIISGRSTVSLADIQQALGDWRTVSTTTTVSVLGIHIKCISSEQADVTGGGYVPQHVAWRLGGCVGGNELSLSGDEDHVRIWNQPAAGSRYGAWFIAASYETMCVVRDGTLVPATGHKAYAALHSGSTYHCVDGGPGSIRTKHPDGYDDAARDFSAAIVAAARGHGWQAAMRTVTVPRGASAGEGGVPFGSAVYVVTVTR
ncbi:MAG TPA: hypothetical protein VF838_04220 [Trebonia sp.]